MSLAKMIAFPDHSVFIDIHSHNPLREERIFRIYNLNLADFEDLNHNGPVSTGLHPWHIHHFEEPDNLRSMLVEAAANESVVAIGETGLDKVINTSMAMQEEVFRTHVDISEEVQKPLIIHCVRAFHDILRIRKETAASQPWIMHGFYSSPEIADEMATLGFYISVGERLLRNKNKSREILDTISREYLFAETDDDDKIDC